MVSTPLAKPIGIMFVLKFQQELSTGLRLYIFGLFMSTDGRVLPNYEAIKAQTSNQPVLATLTMPIGNYCGQEL